MMTTGNGIPVKGLGTAGVPDTDVVTVQGIVGGTPLGLAGNAGLVPTYVDWLPSATRNTYVPTLVISNPGYKGIRLYIAVTAVTGAGKIHPYIYVANTEMPNAWDQLGAVDITTTGNYIYTIYPSGTGGLGTLNRNDVLGSNYQINIWFVSGTSVTYSAGYDLLP